MQYALAIDQGTSGSKALVFDSQGNTIVHTTVPLRSIYRDEGFVEQDPREIMDSVIQAASLAMERFQDLGYARSQVVTVGISNQRESFLLWDRAGNPLSPVVVWQCKRSLAICRRMEAEGLGEAISDASGLRIDPYFSGTKVTWLLEHDASLQAACRAGKVFFGTIDTWLLYNLTEGKAYRTDHSNASRTLFFNLDTLTWDATLIKMLGAEGLRLPEVFPSAHTYGHSTFGGIFAEPVPINSMIGDSHSACFGEGCFQPGTIKATMGTGSSVMMNTGSTRIRSKHGMVSTICWSTSDRVDYALEGVIVSCGSTVNWFQDQMGMVADGAQFDSLAQSVPDSGNVVFLPAFSGLGGPHWQMDRQAEIVGITFGTTKAHMVRAALESYPFQLKDVVSAMEQDIGRPVEWIKADGGMTKSRLTMRYIADLLETELIIDKRKEASAFGTALLAFLQQKVLSFSQIQRLCAESPHDSYDFTDNLRESGYIKDKYRRWLEVVKKG
jgi:glycerol kinase